MSTYIYTRISNEAAALIQKNQNAHAAWKLNTALLSLLQEGQCGGVTEAFCETCLPLVTTAPVIEVNNEWYDEGMSYFTEPLVVCQHESTIPEVIMVLYNLGIAMSRLQHNDKALTLFSEALALLNSDDSQTKSSDKTVLLAAIHNRLGYIHFCGERYFEAILHYNTSLRILKNAKDSNTELFVASTLNCLGVSHLYQSDAGADEAIRFFTEALTIRQFVTGHLNDKESATIMNNIGRAKFNSKDYQGALDMYQTAFQTRQHVLGDLHIDVGATLMNAGQARFCLGDLEAAKELYSEFMTYSSKMHGHDHYYEIVLVLKCLAQVHHRTNKSELAVLTYKQALVKAREIYGNSHPEVAGVLNDMASLSYELGQTSLAIEMFQACLKIDRMVALHSQNYTNAITTMTNLAHILYENGRLFEALEIYLDIIRLHGEDSKAAERNLFVATTWTRIGLIYFHIRQFENAIDCYEYALEIRITVLGENHSSVASILKTIGAIHMKEGAYDLAVVTFEECLGVLRNSPKSNTEEIADTLFDIGEACTANGETPKALSTFEEALGMERTMNNDKRFKVVQILKDMGKIYYSRQQHSKALECFKEAYEFCHIRSLMRSLKSIDVARLLSCIGNTSIAMGDIENGKKSYAEAVAINRRCGRNDDDNLVADGQAIFILSTKRPECSPAA